MDESAPPDFMSIFERQYAPYLDVGSHQRADGFRLIFRLLLASGVSDFRIVETGTTRVAGNWRDGQSTVLFDHFVRAVGGTVLSVDISEASCEEARKIVSGRTRVVCADSVPYLARIPAEQKFDLAYLDSLDLDMRNPGPSALHHLKELVALWKNLRPGSLLALDDTPNIEKGKGSLVHNFMEHLGTKPMFIGYHLIWQI